MELADQIAAHDTRLGSLETDVGKLKARDEERANEMVAISSLATQLRQEREERDDASAKMVASIQGIFERRQTAQDAQLQKLVSGQNAQLSAQRLHVIGVVLGVVAFVFCAYAMHWSYEVSLGAAVAVWTAVKNALASKPPNGGPPPSDPPSGAAPTGIPPLLRASMNGGAP